MPIPIEIKQGIKTTFYIKNKVCRLNFIPIDNKNKMILIENKKLIPIEK